jgi:hypothetical protein
VFFTLVPRQRVERELFWVSGTEARRLRFRALRQALLNPRAPRRCLEALFESLGLPDSYLTRRQYRQWCGETPDETRARALG